MTDCTRNALVYSKPGCPPCAQAKAMLTAANICFEEKVVGIDIQVDELRKQLGNVTSVPQIILDGEHIKCGVSCLQQKINEGTA